MWEFLKGKKTYIVAAMTITYALVVQGWQLGDWASAMDMVFVALGMGSIRHGMNK